MKEAKLQFARKFAMKSTKLAIYIYFFIYVQSFSDVD